VLFIFAPHRILPRSVYWLPNNFPQKTGNAVRALGRLASLARLTPTKSVAPGQQRESGFLTALKAQLVREAKQVGLCDAANIRCLRHDLNSTVTPNVFKFF